MTSQRPATITPRHKKVCRHGHEWLQSVDGQPRQCPDCRKAARKRYRAAHPEKRRAETQRYYKKHPEKKKAATKRHYEKHKNRMVERSKHRRESLTPDQKAAQHQRIKEWRHKHPDKTREYARRKIMLLKDSYIAQLLGAGVSEIPKEIVELKRLHLQLKREARQCKQ